MDEINEEKPEEIGTLDLEGLVAFGETTRERIAELHAGNTEHRKAIKQNTKSVKELQGVLKEIKAAIVTEKKLAHKKISEMK